MSRFSEYLQKTFHFTSAEAEEIIGAMKKPIGKSIRVNTRKIALTEFKLHAQEQGWTLTETDVPEVFLIDRDDTTIALGNTLEHQAGWFYIQEVAAAHPPYLLKQQIKNKPDKILDMCAAPGGKTTQLADYFSESLIIANEVNRTRTPQLFENLDRMGYDNIAVVSCDGRFFQNFPDFFDAVLLDAPCSGEGTAFRDSSVIDHWHEKNIDRIGKLQKQLIETAEAVTAPGGTLSYSTCTLNVMENEEVIDSRLGIERPYLIEVFRKRFWPHIEHTGGFFASIFQKKESTSSVPNYPHLPSRGQKPVVRLATKGERELVERFTLKYLHTKLCDRYLYFSKDTVYFSPKNLTNLSEYFYFVHAGMKIGTIKKNTFEPCHHLFWCLQEKEDISTIRVTPDMVYKKGTTGMKDGWYNIAYGKGIVGIGEIRDGFYQGI